MQHVKPAGTHWSSHLAGLSGDALYAAWKPILEKNGFKVYLTGTLIAHRVVGSSEQWLKSTGNNVEALDVIPAPVVVLPPPATTAAAWVKGQSPEYLAPMPGTTFTSAEILDTVTKTTRGEFIGQPLLRVRYHSDGTISQFEVATVMRAGLTAAGWDTTPQATGGNVVVAHYTANGRDIWAKVSPDGKDYVVDIGDPGMKAASTELAQQLASQGHVALYGIYFDLDKATLRPDSEATLEQVLVLLKGDPKLTLEIQGHTDNTGTHDQPLSEQRAAAVVKWLVDHGVVATRLTSKGYAETKPVENNGTPQGRAKNRRVELLKTSA